MALSNTKMRRGFSLIEIVVAVGVFASLVVLLIGIVISLLASRRRVNNEQVSLTSIRAFLSTMEREIQGGTSFPTTCENGCSALSFVSQVRSDAPLQRIDYVVSGGRVSRAEQRGSGVCAGVDVSFDPVCFVDVTPPSVTVNNAVFYVHNKDPGAAPIIVVVLDMTAGTNPKERVRYKLSESYTPRLSRALGMCEGRAEVMFVLDRSGSIDNDGANPQPFIDYKKALHSLVDAMGPSPGGVHVGQASFAKWGSQDVWLTDDAAQIHAGINALVTGGGTNIAAGIEKGLALLAPAWVRAETPKIMVLVTDGEPTMPCNPLDPLDDLCVGLQNPDPDAFAAAEAKADAARAEGVKIFVLGVGPAINEPWLQNEIADSPNHYGDAADFGLLEQELLNTPICQGL